MKRRDFFKNATLAGMTGITGLTISIDSAAQAEEPTKKAIFAGKKSAPRAAIGDGPSEAMTVYAPDYADKFVWIRRDNQLVAVYRTGPNQKYPYIYPLVGPRSMMPVTTESAQPWPHHRSVFTGLDKVNGGNYWQNANSDGQILSQKVKIVDATETKVVFSDECLWRKPGKDPIMSDSRKYTLDWRCDNYYILDAEFLFTPLVDVTVQRSNHGFFGVRVCSDLAPDGGGFLVNADGASGQKETEGKTSRWCAFYGKRYFNPDITEGVAVFCPPEKPFKNCVWLTRNYGNISPMPFNYDKGPWVFKQGETWEGTYRIVVFAGTPKDVNLNQLWDEIYG